MRLNSCGIPMTMVLSQADFFGRENLGAISAIDTTMHLVGTSVGPVVATMLRAWLGSFNAAFWVLAAVPLVSGSVVLCCATKPRPPRGRSS